MCWKKSSLKGFLQAKWLVLFQYKSNTILSKFNMEPKHGYIMLYSQFVIEKSFFRSKCLKVPCKPLVYSKYSRFLDIQCNIPYIVETVGDQKRLRNGKFVVDAHAGIPCDRRGAAHRGMFEKLWDHPTFRYPYHPISIYIDRNQTHMIIV